MLVLLGDVGTRTHAPYRPVERSEGAHTTVEKSCRETRDLRLIDDRSEDLRAVRTVRKVRFGDLGDEEENERIVGQSDGPL